MITLEEITEMWKKDSVIDEMQLDTASINCVKLHSKYLELLSVFKLQLKRKDHEQKILLRDKWLWYTGKMEKAEMDKRQWKYDPFDGLKVMKSDFEYYYNADADLQRSEELIVYLTTIKETLEEIIGTIRWRHSTFKNIIDWKKFQAGN